MSATSFIFFHLKSGCALGIAPSNRVRVADPGAAEHIEKEDSLVERIPSLSPPPLIKPTPLTEPTPHSVLQRIL